MRNLTSFFVSLFLWLFLTCLPVGLLCQRIQAQTVVISNTVPGYTTASLTNPPTIQSGVQTVVDAVKSGVTNVYVVVDGMYANQLKEHWGGGVGIFWPLSTYVVTGLRIDYLDGGFWMPEGNATLQVPIKLTSWLTVKPFYYAGIGVPVSGAKIDDITVPGKVIDNQGQPTAIYGPGVAVRIYTSKVTAVEPWFIDVAYDQEKWSGFPGTQYRVGIVAQVPWNTMFGLIGKL